MDSEMLYLFSICIKRFRKPICQKYVPKILFVHMSRVVKNPVLKFEQQHLGLRKKFIASWQVRSNLDSRDACSVSQLLVYNTSPHHAVKTPAVYHTKEPETTFPLFTGPKLHWHGHEENNWDRPCTWFFSMVQKRHGSEVRCFMCGVCSACSG